MKTIIENQINMIIIKIIGSTEGKISLFNIEQYKVEQNELIINDISSRYKNKDL